VAIEIGPMATVNPLTDKVTNHTYHSGHPKQETLAEDDHKQCDSRPSPAENSGAGPARKVSSIDGYSGKSGMSVLNQMLAASHRQNTDGYSGKSPSDQQVTSDSKDAADRAGPEFATLADALRADPTIWSDLYEERAAHRQF
jgi:hypothetical protein